jgi:hypothetical protein
MMQDALYDEMLIIFAASQEQVPVDTGRLRASASVERTSTVGEPSVAIRYGTDYAVPVHDRTEVKHVVGKAKYLSDPFEAAQRGMDERLAKRIRRALLGALLGG